MRFKTLNKGGNAPFPPIFGAKVKKENGVLTITQIKSAIGRKPGQKETLVGLGLNKLHKTSTLEDTPAIRGMIDKVSHLLKIEDNK